MENKKAVIYCFSGTGNTEKVAREYKKIFEENGVETLLYSVSDNFDDMPNIKDYDDITNYRILPKENINYSRLATDAYYSFPRDRRTVKSSFEKLAKSKQCKYIRETSKSYHFDNKWKEVDKREKNDKIFTVGISTKVLNIMIENMSENALRVFFYLYREWNYWVKYRGHFGFDFSITQICTSIGYCSTTKENRDMVKNSLTYLKGCGIIEIEESPVRKGRGEYIRLTHVSLQNLENAVYEASFLEEQEEPVEETKVDNTKVNSVFDEDNIDMDDVFDMFEQEYA